MPLSDQARGRAYADGRLEEDDLAVEPRGGLEPKGPRRQRPFAPLAPPEPDPHERVGYPQSRREPLTGAHATLQPQYRRKPPYRSHEDGSASMHFTHEPAEEARRWARCFARDARTCFIRSHLHRCGPTCWKLSKEDEPKSCRVCRLGFYHEFETAVFCHPARKHPASSRVLKWLRAGKDLVLPDGAQVGYDPDDDAANPVGTRLILDDVPADGYGPWAHRCVKYGRAGRVDVVRYHPYHGSTNPCGQACLRCNLDVQCLDRVVLGLPGDDDDVGVVAPPLAETTGAPLDPEATTTTTAILGSPATALPLSESVGVNESGASVTVSPPGAGALGSNEQGGAGEGAASGIVGAASIAVQPATGAACGRLLGGAPNRMDDPEADIFEMESDVGDVGDDVIGPDDWLGVGRDAFERDVPPEEGIAERVGASPPARAAPDAGVPPPAAPGPAGSSSGSCK